MRAQRNAVQAIEKLGGVVFFEQDASGNEMRTGPVWLGKLVREDLFVNVMEVQFRDPSLTDAGLPHLCRLRELRSLALWDARVTDDGLGHLEALTQLRELDLMRTSVGDTGLLHLRGLAELRTLVLANTKVTDAGLVYLRGMAQLQSLDLYDTRVTDTGLVHLRGLSQLRELDLGHTQVTDAGLVHLRGLSHLGSLELADTSVTQAVRKNCKSRCRFCESSFATHLTSLEGDDRRDRAHRSLRSPAAAGCSSACGRTWCLSNAVWPQSGYFRNRGSRCYSAGFFPLQSRTIKARVSLTRKTLERQAEMNTRAFGTRTKAIPARSVQPL